MSELYQNIYINDKLVINGVRQCDTRYQLILSICKKIEKPFSLLDIGSNYGYFSIMLAKEFPDSFFTLIEKDPIVANTCKEICSINSISNITILNTDVNINDLNDLGKCEHFDIVLAMSVVHHFSDNINKVIDIISKIGKYTIFELPAHGENACNQGAVETITVPDRFEFIGRCKSHTADIDRSIYLSKNDKTYFENRRFRWTDTTLDSKIEISRSQNKLFISNSRKNTNEIFKLGINLNTYLIFNGIYPYRIKIIEQLHSFKKLQDPTPWNFIITNDNLEAIDISDEDVNDMSDMTKQSIDIITKLLLYNIDIRSPNFVIIKDWFQYIKHQ